jgi:hypothetical protein
LLTPIITGYGGPIVRADTLQLIGTGFGRVSSAALVDTDGLQWECEFIVDRGTSVTITVPRLLPDGTYIPVLGTLDNIPSQSSAAPLVVPDPLAGVIPPREQPEPVPDPASPATVAIRKRLRMELGDYQERFQTSVTGDGFTRRFDLPQEVISTTGLSVILTDEEGNPVTLAPTDYDLDAQAGVITLPDALAHESTLTMTGVHYQFFTDDELDLFLRSAALKHTHSSEDLQVYRDPDGFKHFLYTNQTVDGLAPVEYHLVALLAATEALEVIQTDVAYDIDVTTAEGTSLPRTERFRNIAQLMATKQAMYDDLAAKLGVGLGRVEVFTLRRVSRTTGKLVPVYVDREYDDVRTPPLRVFAPRNLGVTGSGFDQVDPHSFFGNTP